MRTLRSLAPAAVLTVAAAGLAGLPSPAAADCGGDYATCLGRNGGLESSDSIHDSDCYSQYWRCVGRLLIAF